MRKLVRELESVNTAVIDRRSLGPAFLPRLAGLPGMALLMAAMIAASAFLGMVTVPGVNSIGDITVIAGGIRMHDRAVPLDTTVADVLRRHSITVGLDDVVNPSAELIVRKGQTITVTRVSHVVSEVKEVVPPPQDIYIRADDLQPGERRVVRKAEHGIDEVFYLSTIMNDAVTDRTEVSRKTIATPKPGIVRAGDSPPEGSGANKLSVACPVGASVEFTIYGSDPVFLAEDSGERIWLDSAKVRRTLATGKGGELSVLWFGDRYTWSSSGNAGQCRELSG